MDDIQAGCGRTGTFFSFEPAGIKPGHHHACPSRCRATACRWRSSLLKRSLDVWKPGEHNGTFRGNNHAFVTATAALEHYWRDLGISPRRCVPKASTFGKRLQVLVDKFSPHLVDVRGRGMMIGVRCADPRARGGGDRAKPTEYGLIIERAGPEDEVIKGMMPLTTSYDEIG